MENVIHRITLDLTGPDMCPMIEVQRGDSARSLIISLTQGGRPYWIDEGLTAALFATKPDGNPLFNACTIEKNRIRYDFTPQTVNVAGTYDCEIWLVAGDKRELTTPRFTIAVDERMRTDDVIPESEPEYTAITEMVAAGTAMIEELREALTGLEGVEEILTRARAAMEDAETAASRAADSEAAARGHAKTAADAAADALTLAGQANSAAQQSNKYAFEADQSARSAADMCAAAEVAAESAQAQATNAGDSAQLAAEMRADVRGVLEVVESRAIAVDLAKEQAEEAARKAEEAAERAEEAAAGAGPGEGSGQNVELDTTLTQSGKAADAKAVGDALAELEEKIPESGNTGDPAGTAASMVGAHNDSVEAHPDIRETLDALAEVAGVDVRPQPVTVTLDKVGKNSGTLAMDGSVNADAYFHSDLIPTGGRRRFALNTGLPLIFYAADGSEFMRKGFNEGEFEVGFECAHIRINGTNGWRFGANYTITMSAGTSAAPENLYNATTGLVGGMIDAAVAPIGKHISNFLDGYHPSMWTLLFSNVGAGTYTLVSNDIASIPYHITLDAAGYITGQGGVVTKGTLVKTATRNFQEFALAETDAAYIGIRIGAGQYSDDIMIYKGPAEAYPGRYVAAAEPGEVNPILTAADLRADFADYASGALVSCEDTERQTARLATALNSAQFIRDNKDYKVQLTDYFSHEGNIQIDSNGIAYVVHTSNEVSSYDGSNDTNLKIEMAVVDLEAGEILSKHVVAKHQDVVGGASITSGLGAPNIVLMDSGIVRMIFSAQLDGNPYCSMYRDYDPATGALGAIGKCLLSVDGATYDLAVDTISEHVAPATRTDSCVHHNSQWARHTDGYYYLFITVNNYIKPGVIMRTRDFVTFEPWLVPQLPGDDIAQYEAQVMIKDKYMFLAMRIGDLSKLLIVQIDMGQKQVVATQYTPDCNARSWWMFDGYGMPYLIHGMDSRGRTDIIKFNYQPNPRIILGGVVCQGYGHVYPSVAKYGTYYYMASRISDRVCVTRFRLPWRTSGTVEAALLRLSDMMEI